MYRNRRGVIMLLVDMRMKEIRSQFAIKVS